MVLTLIVILYSYDLYANMVLTWMFVLQSSTTTAQLRAPRRLASGENRGRTDNFFLGAKIAENQKVY